MKGAGNMQTMQQYITEMGLEYSQKQFDACLTAFVSEMERGLAGGASSLKMIPAYCRPTARTVCSSAAAGGRILFGSMRRQRFVSNAAGHAEP